MEKFGEYLAANGVKPSLQRLKIYEYIYKNRIHPTVDMIYTQLSLEIPTLSKTTVYNTLKLFVLKGVAHTVTIEDNEVRYDADTSVHGHFKCLGCGDIFDLPIDKSALQLISSDDFEVNEHHIYLKGYCKICKVAN